MLIKEAKALVRQWVADEVSQLPGFCGAFMAGSTNFLADDDPMPPTSDVDVKIVLDVPELPTSYVKAEYADLVVESSYLLRSEIDSPDKVLTIYFLSKHFTTPCILADPIGFLTETQAVVQRNFAKREWVAKRTRHACDYARHSLTWLDPTTPYHDQAFWWLYSAGIVNHMLMVADLRNPTVAKSWVVTTEVLSKYGFAPFLERMFAHLGCADMDQARVETFFRDYAEAFDYAKQYIKTPFWGSTSITDSARPAVVDKIGGLVASGQHRQAFFFIAFFHMWCHKAILNDAPPEVQAQTAPLFERLVTALGIPTLADIPRRHKETEAFIPEVWQVAEAIIAANPDVVD